MKNNKSFLYAVLSMLSISSLLMACSSKGHHEEEWEEPVYEIGDTVKEWTSKYDFDELPMDLPEGLKGSGKIDNKIGNDDKGSLFFEIEANSSGTGYIASDAMKNPYFTNDDAKNGDIISLCIYAPADSNIDTLELEVDAIDNNTSFNAEEIKITSEKEDKWIRSQIVFDTLSPLSSIKLNYKALDKSKPVQFYVDNIKITYGEETQKNGYEYKDESLREAFKGYLRVGNIMSSNMYNNTKMRQILKDNFNSITAENEAKPERVLDQAACQKLAKDDETAVAITVAPFEKIYDWAEAHHIPVRHHTFVWHQQTPDWFFKKGYQNNGQQVSKEVMLGRLENYYRVMIETLDDRWPGLVYALDVVNEAVEEVGQIRQGNWLNTVGKDYIYQAFKAASKYKMDYQDLYYNDYAFEQTQWGGVDRCQWAVDEMLKQAMDEGLIDGIGIQGHIEFSDVDTILEDARIIHSAGLKCQITELDINCNGEQEFEKQKEAYYKVVKGVLEGNYDDTMDVNAIIVWGVTDNTSWHSNRSPLMFDSNYAKKPAYYGFLEAIEDFAK